MKKNFLVVIYILISFSAFAQETTVIKCDSIYKGKSIFIELINFKNDEYSDDANCTLIIKQRLKNEAKILLKDKTFSSAQQIEFKDFNNDNIKDVLVQNISDARSNWTYNLYLFSPKTNSFTKIGGFEEIKNPIYNSKHKIIESHINSGTNWLAFYKIQNNKVHDYKIEIMDDGSTKAEKEYQKAIKKITEKK